MVTQTRVVFITAFLAVATLCTGASARAEAPDRVNRFDVGLYGAFVRNDGAWTIAVT